MNKSSESGSDDGQLNLGRNSAEGGVLRILSVKTGSGQQQQQYGEFIAADNRLHAESACATVPAQLSHYSAGLMNFDYQAFYRQYTGWTVRDYQTRDPAGYARLYDWLERREEEYRSGVRIDVALPPPTPQQQMLGANTLIDSLAQARTTMSRNQADFRGLRLTELPDLPLRSFIMKRLALRNAELVPLVDLGVANAYRQACLQFLLPARAFHHLSSHANPVAEHTAVSVTA